MTRCTCRGGRTCQTTAFRCMGRHASLGVRLRPCLAMGAFVAILAAVVIGGSDPVHAASARGTSEHAPDDSAATAPNVVDIQFEGLRRVGREAAMSGLQTAIDAPLATAVVTKDLHALWQKHFFSDVQAFTEAVDGGVRLIFVVKEKPSIKEIKYVGRDDVSEDDIKGVVDVRPYTILNVEQLKANVEKIKDLYVGKGFYLADVTYHVEEVPGQPDEVSVVFEITENAKVMVRQITLIGNKAIDAKTIKGSIQTREGNALSWLTQAGTYKEEHFQTDLMRIQALYYDRGYVTVRLGDPKATLSQDRRYIYLTVPITEGEQYNIGTISFGGQVELANDAGKVVVDEAMLRKRLTVKSGEIFSRSKLFEDIQRVTDAYRDQGYAYANVTPNSRVQADTRKVDLELEVERGEIVTIGRIEITGNTRTRDKVIRRQIRIAEGERYSGSAINESKARIYQLGFFETVEITTKQGASSDILDMVVEIKEKSTGTFQVGAGFSSVQKFIATAQISQNNFLGNGQLLSLSAQLSFGAFAQQLATLQFFEPYFLDSQWSFGLNAYITQRYYQDFQRNATGFSPSFGYLLTPDLRISVGYTLEKIQVNTDLLGSAGAALRPLLVDGLNSAVNASLTYDTRNNRLFPTRGMYHMFTVEVSDKVLGSASRLAYRRLQGFTRFYQPLPLGLVFRFNGSAGIVWGPGNSVAPISERFFPGGIYSVRGFQPRGLGPSIPVVTNGDPLASSSKFNFGGNKEVVINIELEFPLIPAANIKGVVFTDAGNAFSDNENFFYVGQSTDVRAYLMGSNRAIAPPLGLFYSFGFGFRWLSPMGPLRFEWGIPITKRSPTDQSMLFQFTIGNFF